MREITIFCFGLGAIAGLFVVVLGVVMYDRAGNVEWQNGVLAVLSGTAVILIGTGFGLLTKSEIAVIASMCVGIGGAVACLPLSFVAVKGTGSTAGCGLLLPGACLLFLVARSSTALSKRSLAYRRR